MTGSRGFAAPLDALSVQRLRLGERAALGQAYDLYGRSMFTLALRITGRPSAAEDVVQDTWLKALQALDGHRGDAPFGAWLRRLTVNTALDRLRAEHRWLALDSIDEPAAADSAHGEHAQEALGLLRRLSPAARTVVVLHTLEGYSHAELGALFGRSESWSKSLLSRALARLQAELSEETLHDPR